MTQTPTLDDYPARAFDKLRYGDTDRQGHVNNAVFATFFETGRVELLLAADRPLIGPGTSLVLARLEVDLVAEVGGQIIPFEVKYRAQHTGLRDLKGLLELCQQKSIDRGYVVTKSLDDFGVIADLPDTTTRILRIPAPLLCYWMGEFELTPEQQ